MSVVANNANGSSAAKTYTETVTDIPMTINFIPNRSGEEGNNITFNVTMPRASTEFASDAAFLAAVSLQKTESAVTGVTITGVIQAAGTVTINANAVNSAVAATTVKVLVMDDGVQRESNQFTLGADPAI